MKEIKAILFIFVIRIAFNVFLPSFDTYSDVSLAYKAFTFSLGESLLLSGCRVCQGKDETEIYTLKNKSCQQCLVMSEIIHLQSNLPSSKIVNLYDACGYSYEFLNKMHELEKKDTCENEPVSLSVSFDSTTNSNVLKNECDFPQQNNCCVENENNRNSSGVMDTLEKSFFVDQSKKIDHEKNSMNYNILLLSGKLSVLYCQSVFFDYFTMTTESYNFKRIDYIKYIQSLPYEDK